PLDPLEDFGAWPICNFNNAFTGWLKSRADSERRFAGWAFACGNRNYSTAGRITAFCYGPAADAVRQSPCVVSHQIGKRKSEVAFGAFSFAEAYPIITAWIGASEFHTTSTDLSVGGLLFLLNMFTSFVGLCAFCNQTQGWKFQIMEWTPLRG